MGAPLEVDTLASTRAAGTVAPVSQQEFMRRLAPCLPALKRFALRLTGNLDDSEDLVQDVLLKLFERTERLAGVNLMQPWLLRVMYHQFIDRCRRSAPQGYTVSIDELAAAEDGGDGALSLALSDEEAVPEAVVERLEVASAVSSAIGQLPEPQQALVRMHEIEGLSLGEIAAHCGLSINTIKSSLSRARTRLRQDLLGRRAGLSWRRRENATPAVVAAGD